MDDATERIRAAVERNTAGVVGCLQELVRLGRAGEAAVQARVAEACRALGCTVEQVRYRPAEVPLRLEFAATGAMAAEQREAVVARLAAAGGGGDGRSLIFFAHPDGEPVQDTARWRHDPFAGVIDRGRLHGWGVADDLAGVAIMVQALGALATAGLRPAGEVILASTPSKRHARGVAALLHRGCTADAAIYLHPAESGAGMREIKAFASGQLEFRITVAGRLPDTEEPSHAAFAHRAVNPIEKAWLVHRALAALDARRGDRVRHATLQEAIGRSTNLMVSHIRADSDALSGRIPATCVMGGVLSFPPGEALAAVQAEVAEALAEATAADPWLRVHPPVLEWISGVTGAEVPAAHPLYRAVGAAVAAVTGAPPMVNPLHTASDIRNPMVQKGIPCVGLGPLCGDLSQTGGHDEWVDVDDYLRAVAVAACAIAAWCGTVPAPGGPGNAGLAAPV